MSFFEKFEENSSASHQHDIVESKSTHSHDSLTTCAPSLTSVTIEEASRHHTFPDGGPKAWLTVFGAFLALFCTFGQMNAFGTFQAWYSNHQLSHLPASTISWIGSIQLWVFFFSGGIIGCVFDKHGPRVLMIAGTTLYVFSIMMMSISTELYHYILAQGIVFGLGVGLIFYPCLASISTHFMQYRGTALGIAAAGSSLGGVVYPIMLQNLFEKVGFGWGVRITGFISFVFCGIAVLTVTSTRPSGKKSIPGLGMNTFKDARFILLAAGSSLVALGLFIPFFYIIDYAHDLSISAHMSFVVLAVMNAGGIFGRIAPAYLSDIIGRFNLLAPSAFMSGLLSLVLWLFAKDLVSLMFFSATYGFFSGAFISVVTPCVAQISDIREIGSRIGILYSIISFPALVGGPIAGVLLMSGHGSYTGMILFSGITVMAGSFFIIGARLMIDSRLLARV